MEAQKTDTNIDHRRVPNLIVFFKKFGVSLKISKNPQDYQPGDIVTWDLGNNTPHIGLVSNLKSSNKKRYLIIHNIGLGPEIEDMLFDYTITGHFQYHTK